MALITRTQFIKKPVDEVFAVVADGASPVFRKAPDNRHERRE
jgi:hypothetical protein